MHINGSSGAGGGGWEGTVTMTKVHRVVRRSSLDENGRIIDELYAFENMESLQLSLAEDFQQKFSHNFPSALCCN